MKIKKIYKKKTIFFAFFCFSFLNSDSDFTQNVAKQDVSDFCDMNFLICIRKSSIRLIPRKNIWYSFLCKIFVSNMFFENKKVFCSKKNFVWNILIENKNSLWEEKAYLFIQRNGSTTIWPNHEKNHSRKTQRGFFF